MANVLNPEKRAAIISALVEGNGVRATARIVGVSKDTVAKLLVEIGAACARYQAETLVGLPCKRVQVDEIWSFVYAKAKNVPSHMTGQFGVGDVWTFTAIDADSKLCVSWLVGPRDGGTATEFMQDVADRLARRIQTNAFSKKLENHVAAVALHFMHYNFCRIHQTLRVTPAMAAAVSDHPWEISELVALLARPN